MTGGKILEQIEIDLKGQDSVLTVYLDIYQSSLSKKWLASLNDLLTNDYHLEKNYCFFGFLESERNGPYLLDCVNQSIAAINQSNIGYHIDDWFDMSNTITDDPVPDKQTSSTRDKGRNIIHSKFNNLHRYFEDLQGVSGAMSEFFLRADARTRWHISQLNLLCHEFESWALSYRREIEGKEWRRPSQLMCWLRAPRFQLDEEDYELFGIETISRPLGGVFVGVNKAVGKHHWEVFNDEGRDSRINELTTTTLRNQTEASGDFDIEWGLDPSKFEWQKKVLAEFRQWLIANKFDPDDKSLTIGHPQVGQVDLERSFGTQDNFAIWEKLGQHLDVHEIRTSTTKATYPYHWKDHDFIDRQVAILEQRN